jgi:hypothetical protein
MSSRLHFCNQIVIVKAMGDSIQSEELEFPEMQRVSRVGNKTLNVPALESLNGIYGITTTIRGGNGSMRTYTDHFP